MKLGIMQPYFFPYIGYWQLLNAVDKYLIVDNVNYIKNGFINRNKILVNGEPFNFGISVKKASQNKLICEHEQGLDESSVNKLLATLKSAYAKAPYFTDTYDLVKEVLEFGLIPEGRNLSIFLDNAIRLTSKKLGIETPINLTSKDVPLDGDYKREHLVVAYCKKLKADEYVNAIGGTGLYFQNFFRENGVGLKFLKTHEDICYSQNRELFIPNLSIIDVMMYCSPEEISQMLGQYTLIDGYESPENLPG
ncbi:WbqC family protein [Butyrivibrio sp. FCS006]|uniref:WbqC family protein n=1 Tax=Butyrivibrio sp. FCS006 TaxID=1280684 RepID=UPI0003F89812|nr:WbqC family protein [Butyrivibrio sp. FCS006]